MVGVRIRSSLALVLVLAVALSMLGTAVYADEVVDDGVDTNDVGLLQDVGGPGCPPAVDEFEGDALGAHWTVVEPEPDLLSVADGRLSIQTVQGRDFFAGDGTLPNVVVRDMPSGSWTATVEMEFNPTQNFQNAGFVVWTDEDNYIKTGLVHANQLAFEMIKEVGGTADFSPGNVPVGGGFPDEFLLQLAYDGSQLVASFSTDGEDWTQIGTANLTGLDDPGIGLYATNSMSAGATNPPVAHFDSFVLESDEGSAERSVSDQFDGDQLDGCRWDRTVRYDPDTLEVSDGWLRIDTSPEDIFGGDNTDPTNFVLQDAPEGDWIVETRMDAPLERNFQNAGFLVYQDDDNYLKSGVVALNQPGQARNLAFEMATEVGGQVQFPLVNDPVPDAQNDEWWLRLTKEGDSYTMSWSLDGEQFTDLSGSRDIVLDDAAFGLYAVGTGNQVDPVTISWDYFELLDEDDPGEPGEPGEPGDGDYEVLFFHLTTGFRHGSIEAAIEAVEEIGADNDFTVTETTDPSVFTDEGLRPYAAVVFFTDGENTLDAEQRTAFERYIHRGGGFVGLHSTSNMDNQGWPWWEDLMGGAFFDNHPPIQDGTLQIEDADHPSTAHFPDATFEWPDDEWYNFTANPRDAGVHVLVTVDPDSFTGSQMGDDHPIAWCSNFDGGRTFYTAIGHSDFHYDIPEFRDHILGGIEWAAGVEDGECGDDRMAAPTDASFEKVAIDTDTENPMKMDISSDGRVFFTEIAGTFKIWNPVTENTTVAAEIDVYRDHENGLLGVALDPDFDDNGHIFLYYSAPDEDVQHLSRFDFDEITQTLDLDSEQLLLEVPHQRDECCHSSGELDFDSQGNLYLSTGDDTNPFGSQNFAPIDYRDNRAPWDAARTSGNTADLRGKVLRITPLDDPGDEPGLGSTYTVPDDNLFTSGEWDHLFPGGEYDPEIGRPEIYVMGLRNPFAISVDLETDHLYIGDVGPDSNPSGGFNPDRGPWGYDSWTQVREATNKGWPFCYQYDDPYRQWDFETETPGEFYDCEAGAVNDSPRNTGLEQLPPATSRTLWYPYCTGNGNYNGTPPFPEIPCGPHPEGGQNYGTGRAAYMGDVYNYDPEVDDVGAFPEYYDGKPFVLEWERDFVATIDLDEDGAFVEGSFEEFLPRARFDDGQRFRSPHALQFGPDGHMYVIEWGDNFNFGAGAVNPDSGLYRISYVRDGRSPIAQASATPDSGHPDLEVQFSSEGSVDRDGGELTYVWDLDDGDATSTEPNPIHTFTEQGVYEVQLTVTSEAGLSASDTVTVTVGNTRPEVTIETPPDGRTFAWGDEVSYVVSVEDAEDGSTAGGELDCADVTVVAGLSAAGAINEPVVEWSSESGCEGSFVPDLGNFGPGDNVTAVVIASYTDDGGDVEVPLTGETLHRLQPLRKQAQFFTDSQGITTSASGDSQCCGDAITGSDGAWASYTPYNLEGLEEVTLRAASTDDATIELRRDAPDGELLASVEIESTTSFDRVESIDGFGSAVQLNGPSPNAYVEMPTGILSDLDGDFTIATWVNRGQLGQQWARIFDFGSGTSNFLFLAPNAGGDPSGMRVDFNTGSGSQFIPAQGSPGTQLGTGWQHVALTLSGNTGTIWLNGEVYASNDNITERADGLGDTDQNWIGRSQFSADPLLNATIDDFQIYDYALDEDEVGSLMETPGGTPGGGNVAWYQFDEDEGSTAVDSSGNDAHATIVQEEGASSYTNVTVDLADTQGSFPLYVVFPDGEARLNYFDFGDPDEEPVVPVLPPCLSVDVDEFEGDALADPWSVAEPEPDLLSVADGRLSIQTVQGRDFFAGDGTLPNVVVRDMPGGSWTATVEMEFNPTQNFQNAGFVVWTDEDNYIKAGLVHAGGLAFEMIKEVGGTADFSPGNVGVDGDFPDEFLLQLAYDGSQLVASFSTDGEDWTQIGTANLTGLDDPGVGLYATNSTSGDATNPPVAHFDSFTLESADGSAERSVTDQFDGDQLDGCRWDRTVRYDPETLEVSDGWLRIDTSPEDIFGGDNTDPTNFVLQDAPEGDWIVETRMDAPLERNFQNAGFLVYQDDDNYLKTGVVALNQPGDARDLILEMAAEVDGDVELTSDPAPDSDNDDWWLRLTKQGDSYTLSWSTDGETFTDLSDSLDIELDDPAVGLYAVGTANQVEPVTISWDYFELLDEDVDPPLTVEASLSPSEPDGDNGWWTSPVELGLSSNEAEADLAWRAAGEDDWTAWTAPVVFDEDGSYELEFRATLGDEDDDGDNGDDDGDHEPVSHDVELVGFEFVPDELTVTQGDTIVYEQVSGPPHNVVTVNPAGDEVDRNGPASSDWDVYEFTASDAGLFYVYCEPHVTMNTSDPATWTGMVLELQVEPGGNGGGPGGGFVSSEVGEVSFDIDQTPPETSASLAGGQDGEAYVDEVSVTLDASDATSGVASTVYRVDGGDEQSYDGAFTVEGEGSYTVEYRSTDVAGNLEDWQSVSFEIVEDDGGPIDPEAPSIEISLDPSSPDGDNGWYVSPVTLTLSSDDDSAVVEWRQVGDDEWVVYEGPVTVSTDGEYEAEARATNDAGSSEIETVEFRIDQTPPETSASLAGGQDGEAYVDEVSVTLDASDATSGVASTVYRVDGGDEQSYDGAFTVEGEGSYTVEFRSTDVAGNLEDWQSVSFEIIDDDDPTDPTDPTDPVTPPPPGEVCARHQGGASFPDAPGSGHRAFIDCLAALGIVEGHADGTFRPADDVSRGQLASFVVRAIELSTGESMPTGGALFPDVGVNSTHGQAIYKLRNVGIIRGYEDGTFQPRASVTRDQTARYVVNALEYVLGYELPRSGASFPDVAPGNQYAGDIDKLVTARVVSGFTDGTFGPRQPVTRGQMTRFIGNALDVLAAEGAYDGP